MQRCLHHYGVEQIIGALLLDIGCGGDFHRGHRCVRTGDFALVSDDAAKVDQQRLKLCTMLPSSRVRLCTLRNEPADRFAGVSSRSTPVAQATSQVRCTGQTRQHPPPRVRQAGWCRATSVWWPVCCWVPESPVFTAFPRNTGHVYAENFSLTVRFYRAKKARRTGGLRTGIQSVQSTEAAAAASFTSCCNSPLSYISTMMSQPPTNSPCTTVGETSASWRRPADGREFRDY